MTQRKYTRRQLDIMAANAIPREVPSSRMSWHLDVQNADERVLVLVVEWRSHGKDGVETHTINVELE